MELGNLYQALIGLATACILAFIPVVAVYGRKFINAHVKDKDLQKSLLVTEQVIMDSVRNTIQNSSADFTKAVADGTLTPEELATIKANAIADYKTHVAPELQKRLDESVSQAEGWVGKKALGFAQELDTVTN